MTDETKEDSKIVDIKSFEHKRKNFTPESYELNTDEEINEYILELHVHLDNLENLLEQEKIKSKTLQKVVDKLIKELGNKKPVEVKKY